MNMKKYRFLFLPLFILIILPSLRLSASVRFVDAALSEIRKMAAQEGKLYFAHFSADWCMPCQWMEQNTFQDPKLAHFVNQNYLAARLDVDHSEGQWYQSQYKVEALPTILIFSSQGVLLNRIEASMEADEFLKVLESYNRPANRISVRPPQLLAVNVPVLESPKASFVFSRPALIPERQEFLASANQPVFARQTTVRAAVEKPVRSYPQSEPLAFTPKSVAKYCIQTGVYSQYKNAVNQVHLLEEDFDQPVHLISQKNNGQLLYFVTIGDFSSKTKAKNFLYFLLRNDVKGELKEK
jgi:thioredoxin-related protein